ncbi:MAG TPA: YihA family ribosome biogenesis GTP-binding protein [Candidatus Merdimorpha stercoravium]|uniref:Probable GTP-binding protein EngB n=1 Tax=Candidatus Merdimorpha stercoravium TaxID=2840863 RepID=A0A9D1H9C2_9FLAO|nr:YihA family ribosome biogenesis GTP-binding protein [Candidatus Merdimorpha stercoravium]
MNITQAAFVTSSADPERVPVFHAPEYAFIGRSNVGKSSLINALCRRRIAKTSQIPGKTQLINHFRINDSWYLVDLPGYGYARTSKVQRAGFSRLITSYILSRRNLATVFVLVDARHAPLKSDLDFITWLGENGIPIAICLTKADKLTRGALAQNLAVYRTALATQWEELPPMIVTSSASSVGMDEILDYIEHTNQELSAL